MGELAESRSRPVFRAVFPARSTVLAPRGAHEMFTGGGGTGMKRGLRCGWSGDGGGGRLERNHNSQHLLRPLCAKKHMLSSADASR